MATRRTAQKALTAMRHDGVLPSFAEKTRLVIGTEGGALLTLDWKPPELDNGKLGVSTHPDTHTHTHTHTHTLKKKQ